MSALLNVISSLIIFVSAWVFASSTARPVSQPEEQVVPLQSVTVPAEPEDPAKTAFVTECARYGFTAAQCNEIWSGPTAEQPESNVKVVSADRKLQVDNAEYVARREEILKRPDAVILHATIR